MDWYPRPIIKSNHSICTFKNKPTSNHNTLSFFQNLFTCTISHMPHSIKCFMGLLRTFNYINNFSIVVYFVMTWPWLNKWKIKANYTSFFFLVNISYTMNHLLQHCFKTFSKIQLLIGNMNVVFQKKKITPNMATQALCQLAFVHKKYNLGGRNLFLPSI